MYKRQAYKAFNYTSNYDLQISKWFSKINKKDFTKLEMNGGKFKDDLTYGENAHQKAEFFQDEETRKNWGNFKKLQGKKLSYNNHLDLDASLNLLYNFKNFKEDIVGIIKHTNPCGVASGKNLLEAFNNAMACDPISAFGGIIVFNKKVQKVVANKLNNYFFEMIVAPGFDSEAERILTKKKNLRLISLKTNWRSNKMKETEFRSVIQEH